MPTIFGAKIQEEKIRVFLANPETKEVAVDIGVGFTKYPTSITKQGGASIQVEVSGLNAALSRSWTETSIIERLNRFFKSVNYNELGFFFSSESRKGAGDQKLTVAYAQPPKPRQETTIPVSMAKA